MQDEKNYTGTIPDHEDGKIIDAVQSVTLPDEAAARAFYIVARDRLKGVNNWHALGGTLSAKFQIVDAAGNEVQRPVAEGDYFKIDIPGPGSPAGGGWDWVKVEQVTEIERGDVQSLGIRVRPTQSPDNPEGDIAHFYHPDATSTFTVTREGNTVTVGIYDRNTKPNTSPHGLADKLRDAAVGAGAVLTGSKLQWSSLAEGILSDGGARQVIQ